MTPRNKVIMTSQLFQPGEYLEKVDRVMTQVDRITEIIDHMPVAAFIFRDKESDEVPYSTVIRYILIMQKKNIINFVI